MQVCQLTTSQNGRLFVVSELYGHFPALNTWLNSVDFKPSADTLILLGNFVGFAATSKQVSAYLQKPWIHAVLGKNEADLLTRLEAPDAQNPTLIGQWLPLLDELDRAELHRALKALPIAIEWEHLGEKVVFSHSPAPEDLHWDTLKDKLENLASPLAALALFMSRLETLGCMGLLGRTPSRPAPGADWCFSGVSVEKVGKTPYVSGNRIIVPSSACLAHNPCYDVRSMLGSLEIKAFIRKHESTLCQIDILPALYQKKTSSTKPL